MDSAKVHRMKVKDASKMLTSNSKKIQIKMKVFVPLLVKEPKYFSSFWYFWESQLQSPFPSELFLEIETMTTQLLHINFVNWNHLNVQVCQRNSKNIFPKILRPKTKLLLQFKLVKF